MMIRGIENLNIINIIGDRIIHLTEGKFDMAVIAVTWLSAAFTSIIGNVANAATVSKILGVMVPSFDGLGNTQAFWWALSLVLV